VNSFVAGAVAVVVGGALAFATALGVVNIVSDNNPSQPDASVVDYGTTATTN
jgi:hypothetical protein